MWEIYGRYTAHRGAILVDLEHLRVPERGGDHAQVERGHLVRGVVRARVGLRLRLGLRLGLRLRLRLRDRDAGRVRRSGRERAPAPSSG